MKLKLTDGKALGVPYIYPSFPKIAFTTLPLPEAPLPGIDPDPPLVEYAANCQCGATTYTIRIPSFQDSTVNIYNCSICYRNAYALVYPHKSNVTFHTGYDKLADYSFNTTKNTHKFCKVCGSSVMIDMAGFGQEKWAMNVSAS